MTTFILRDPKTRKISKADFRDRIVHHAICQTIEPMYDKTFISDSYANRMGKGTLNAIKRFDHFKRKASKNNTATCYVLKADIRHYFDTVDHETLINILQRKIADEKLINLIRKVLDNHDTKIPSKGMPLGNLTSQFFANLYLNELDQYVKHTLKAKYYIRYVDDFVILDTSKTRLKKHKEKIDAFLKQQLLLELHPDKSRILTLDKGINFLGFRIFYHHKLLGTKNKNRFKKRLRQLQKDYEHNKIERELVVEKLQGWLAYAKNADTYKTRREIAKQFNKAFPARKEAIIQAPNKHENLQKSADTANLEFSTQKTLQLFKKGRTISQIATQRGVKEGTIWQHLATLVEHHELRLKEVLPNHKIKKILKHIRTPGDKLKDIKERLRDPTITYDEIAVVLANTRGKTKKKSTTYYAAWYQRTNCYRKCYGNKQQREACKKKFQELSTKTSMSFTKKEFIEFVNNHTNICQLQKADKERHVTWKEFKKQPRGLH